MIAQLPVTITGHCQITDDLGHVLLNQTNAIHPQNMARVISRALSREDNCWIDRIAFGNGGTYRTRVSGVDIINYKTPNDGIQDGQEWQSTLYNETYSENVDTAPGTGAGSAEPIVTIGTSGLMLNKPISNEPISTDNSTSGIGCVSLDKDRISQVVVACTLTKNDVVSQLPVDYDPRYDQTTRYSIPAGEAFVFDEIGLYTSGAPIVATSGTQEIQLNNKRLTDHCISAGTYYFTLVIDGVTSTIKLKISDSTFQQLVDTLTVRLAAYGAKVTMSDEASAIIKPTYGNMVFSCLSSGNTSNINVLIQSRADWLFAHMAGFVKILKPVQGINAANKNNPFVSEREATRLLTHIVFSPILKAANRTFNVKYTLSVFVNRTSTLPIVSAIEPYHYNTNTTMLQHIITIIDDTGHTIYSHVFDIEDSDAVLFFNNATVVGDVWSIGGVAVNNVFVANSKNFKPVLPTAYTASLNKASIEAGNTLNSVLDTNVQSQFDITYITDASEMSINSLSVFSNGKLPNALNGSQTILLTPTTVLSNTGLVANHLYQFNITIDGGEPQNVVIDTAQHTITTYYMLTTLLNNSLNDIGATVSYNGHLLFESLNAGVESSIIIDDSTDEDWLFSNLAQYSSTANPIPGGTVWDPNSTHYLTNDPRLLISSNFADINKPANKQYTIKQTIKVLK
jgi:hypothetical protein